MKVLADMRSALTYEFRMQVRRPTLWITFAVFTALMFALLNRGDAALGVYYPNLIRHAPLSKVVADWALNVNKTLAICVGCLLAGRLPRDRRTRVDELFASMPASLGARLWGKFLGATLATVVPMAVIYAIGVGYIVSVSHDLAAIPLAVETFAVLALPGLLFVGAFSIAVPALLWVPIYQFLFIGYWYWNTLWFHRELPNLGRTLLSPIGLFIGMGIYGLDESSTGQHPIRMTGTLLDGVVSLVLLLVIAATVMIALERFLQWRQARQ